MHGADSKALVRAVICEFVTRWARAICAVLLSDATGMSDRTSDKPINKNFTTLSFNNLANLAGFRDSDRHLHGLQLRAAGWSACGFPFHLTRSAWPKPMPRAT
jgi:hypothetical protein